MVGGIALLIVGEARVVAGSPDGAVGEKVTISGPFPVEALVKGVLSKVRERSNLGNTSDYGGQR